MPDFSASATQTYSTVSIQLRDFTGKSTTASISRADPTATAGEVDALRTAVGNASNARVMAESATVVQAIVNIADPLNTVYDEAYSTVDDAIVFLFQNTDGNVQRLRLPAPDLSLFLADGETVDLTNAQVLAVRDAALAVLPAGYLFLRVYLEGLGRRIRTPLPVDEPGELDLPPQLPASEGI